MSVSQMGLLDIHPLQALNPHSIDNRWCVLFHFLLAIQMYHHCHSHLEW